MPEIYSDKLPKAVPAGKSKNGLFCKSLAICKDAIKPPAIDSLYPSRPVI